MPVAVCVCVCVCVCVLWGGEYLGKDVLLLLLGDARVEIFLELVHPGVRAEGLARQRLNEVQKGLPVAGIPVALRELWPNIRVIHDVVVLGQKVPVGFRGDDMSVLFFFFPVIFLPLF